MHIDYRDDKLTAAGARTTHTHTHTRSCKPEGARCTKLDVKGGPIMAAAAQTTQTTARCPRERIFSSSTSRAAITRRRPLGPHTHT